jgi:hypothetical protein
VVVLTALAVPLFGGRLGALVEIRLRHVWAIFAALALEIAAMELPGLPEGLRAALTVAAYPVGVVFLVANWHLPGMPLVALGAALNLLAISVNGGVMPASPSALAGAGLGWTSPGSRTRPSWPSRGWGSWATSSTFLPPGRSATSSVSGTC